MQETRQTLKIQDKLQINNVTQRKGMILGGTGSGKTTTLKLLALYSPVSVYIFDVLDIIHIKGFQRIGISKKAIATAKDAGLLINKLHVKKGIIFSFKNLLQSEIVDFCEGFFSTWKPQNCLIFFDEIHEAVPQGSGIYSHEVERIWRHGRNSNIGFFADSQRPALVNKNVLALTDYLIVYRTTWEHDLEAIKSVLSNGMTKAEIENKLKNIQTNDFLNGYVIDFQPNSYDNKLDKSLKKDAAPDTSIIPQEKQVYIPERNT